jgi:hypothetical protein
MFSISNIALLFNLIAPKSLELTVDLRLGEPLVPPWWANDSLRIGEIPRPARRASLVEE